MQFTLEHIADYFEGRMTDEQRHSFELELKTDENLQKEAELYKEMKSFATSHDQIEESFSSLHEVHQEFVDSKQENNYEASSGEPRDPTVMKTAITAFIILLAAMAAYFLLFKQDKPSLPEEMFAMHFDPSEISLTSRGDADVSMLADISSAFNASDYQEVVSIIDKNDVDYISNPQLDYNRCISLIALDRGEEARDGLLNLVENHPIFEDDANWYIALSYLSENNSTQAREFLSKIPLDHKNFGDSQEILNNLK